MTQLQPTACHLNERDAAAFLGVKVTTLQAWRHRKLGPSYCKFSKAVRYPIHALAEYAAQNEVQPK